MPRTASGSEVLEQAQQALREAETVEELRQAQAVVLPLRLGLSIERTAAVLGVSVGWACQLRRCFTSAGHLVPRKPAPAQGATCLYEPGRGSGAPGAVHRTRQPGAYRGTWPAGAICPKEVKRSLWQTAVTTRKACQTLKQRQRPRSFAVLPAMPQFSFGMSCSQTRTFSRVSARPAAFLPKRSGRARSSAAGWLRSAASTAVA